MKAKSKIRIMFAITFIMVMALPFVWLFLEASIIAKIVFTILILLDVINFASTYKTLKSEEEVEFVSRQGLKIMVVGFLTLALVLLVVILVK